MNNHFVIPGSFKKWTLGLGLVGIVTLIAGFIFLNPFAGSHGDNLNSTRFWAVLLQNSVYFLLIVNAAMFFMCITTMAMGGWQVALRRVPEAISSLVPILGVVTLVVVFSIILGHRYDIYLWLDKGAVEKNHLLSGKKGFLNPVFYAVASIAAIGLWSFIGNKLRQLSLQSDENGPMDFETGKRWIGKNIFWAAAFLIVFTLTVASSLPWLWLMSIDPLWFSTMYSWYTFASTFVSGIALITIFVVYLKNRGELEYVTEEHLHDLGKFMFAFSIFWTYLWFSQYMLIWYANIPEETVYFKIRVQGEYKGLFYFNLIVNFVAPLIILMKKSTKRNYTIITFMSVLIIFGHWIDFYQMVMPGTVKHHPHLSWFEFGIPLGFVALIMWGVGRYLSKAPLTPMNHPFMKESIIHHT
ncbi:hypothetical protein BH09BAC2_BH09BAC2_03470 [soil metagenome]